MKKTILILSFLLFAVHINAQDLILLNRVQPVASGGCATVEQSETCSNNPYTYNNGSYSTWQYMSFEFVADTTASDYCGVEVYTDGETGTVVGDTILYIYSDTGSNVPDAAITNGTSDGIDATDVTVSGYTKYSMPSNFSLTASTTYHFVYYVPYTSPDATNYVGIPCADDCTTEHIYSDNDGDFSSGATERSTTRGLRFKLIRE